MVGLPKAKWSWVSNIFFVIPPPFVISLKSNSSKKILEYLTFSKQFNYC
jgi:hypothetical protein